MLLVKLAGVEDMDAARAQVGKTYYFAKRMPNCRRAAILLMI